MNTVDERGHIRWEDFIGLIYSLVDDVQDIFQRLHRIEDALGIPPLQHREEEEEEDSGIPF